MDPDACLHFSNSSLRRVAYASKCHLVEPDVPTRWQSNRRRFGYFHVPTWLPIGVGRQFHHSPVSQQFVEFRDSSARVLQKCLDNASSYDAPFNMWPCSTIHHRPTGTNIVEGAVCREQNGRHCHLRLCSRFCTSFNCFFGFNFYKLTILLPTTRE